MEAGVEPGTGPALQTAMCPKPRELNTAPKPGTCIYLKINSGPDATIRNEVGKYVILKHPFFCRNC